VLDVLVLPVVVVDLVVDGREMSPREVVATVAAFAPGMISS
jgi:hypothetical protein